MPPKIQKSKPKPDCKTGPRMTNGKCPCKHGPRKADGKCPTKPVVKKPKKECAKGPRKANGKCPTKAPAKPKKECKYGPRKPDGKCPTKPTATKKACKHGPRKANGKCPPKPSTSTTTTRTRKVYRDSIHRITNAQILRLARRAGVKRISSLMYDEIRGLLKVLVEKIIVNAYFVMTHGRRKTLNVTDLQVAIDAANIQGLTSRMMVNQNVSNLKTCKAFKTTSKQKFANPKWLKEVKHYQSNTCLLLAVGPFKALVTEILREQANVGYRVPENVSKLLQAMVEAYLVTKLQESQMAAIHAKRETVKPKNLQLISDRLSSGSWL